MSAKLLSRITTEFYENLDTIPAKPGLKGAFRDMGLNCPAIIS
jgi:hypothetical protein